MALLNYQPPTTPYLDIQYRDDDIAVLIKPHGLLSVPGKAIEHRDSLHNRLLRVFPTASVIHRLDMATSGIIIFALNKDAHRKIAKQFELREVKKRYLALVHGTIEEKTDSIDLPLRCDWPNRPKQMVDHENGKPSLTHYEVLQTDGDISMVALSPVTGRSHQLRVHMMSIGHPILGDRLYATDLALNMASRLCLHATYISFRHPQTNEIVEFESKPSLGQFVKKAEN